MEGQGDADLQIGLYRLHGGFGRLMGTHNQSVPILRTAADKGLGLGSAEDLHVLRRLLFHPLHHGVTVQMEFSAEDRALS